jgi:hypothetical protein
MTETRVNLGSFLRLTITRWGELFPPTVEVDFFENSTSYHTPGEWRSVELDTAEVAALIAALTAVLPEMSSSVRT